MNTFIRKFSEAALNRASKFKANELPIQLEKLVKQYINESLNKHTNNINKLMIDNERHVMQSIDRKNKDEFWKILSISLTGFGSLVGLNFIIKNEIKEELRDNKNELKNDLKDLKNELKDLKNDIDKKIEKIENKLDILINMKK